jgi:hypothetical protein
MSAGRCDPSKKEEKRILNQDLKVTTRAVILIKIASSVSLAVFYHSTGILKGNCNDGIAQATVW